MKVWLLVFSAFALLFSLHAGLLYFSQAVIAGTISTFLFIFIFLTIAGCGRMAFRMFDVRQSSESEKTLIGATLGLGILSQCIFLLGMVGLLKVWAITGLLGVFWVIGFTEMGDLLKSLGANKNLLSERPLLSGAVLGVLLMLFWICWLPPHQYDSLVYHLPLADAYVREGHIFPLWHLLYSHFPQNGEMLFTLALLFGSDILAQMFSWLGTFLSVWWLFEMGKRELPLTVVLGGCFLTVTHTALMLLTPTSYVECLVMLWITASLLSFFRWRFSSNDEISTRGWLGLAGLFAGLGIGTKYYAGICPIILGAYLLYQWLRMRPWSQGGSYVHSRFKDGATFFVFSSLAGLPWLIKNAWVLGNPVFPFFHNIFPLHGIDWAQESANRYFEILTEYGHSKGHFFTDLLQFPYLAATGSQRFGGGQDVLGDLGWTLILVALPIMFWASWKNKYLRGLLLYSLGHWVIWFFTGVVLRFLVCLIPILSLLAAHALFKTWEQLKTGGRICLGAAVAVLLWTNMGLFFYVHSVWGSLPVLVGMQSRSQYLSKRLDYYNCAAFARDNIGENDRILVVGEQRGYYVKQAHVTTTAMAPNKFVQIANSSKDGADLGRRLKEERGLGYLLFVPREAKRLGEGYGVFHFSEQGFKNWAELEENGVKEVYNSPGRCLLYQLM